MQDTIFTKIIRGEISAHKIYEDEDTLAFLTINPLTDGHTLVVPKIQVDQLWDLDTDNYQALWQTSQKVALHLREVMGAERVGVVVKGFEVPHAHIHLIPVMPGESINFDPEPSPPQADDKRLAEVASRLRF